MRVIKGPRSDSDGGCVNKNVRGNKGVYKITLSFSKQTTQLGYTTKS